MSNHQKTVQLLYGLADGLSGDLETANIGTIIETAAREMESLAAQRDRAVHALRGLLDAAEEPDGFLAAVRGAHAALRMLAQ